MCISLFSPEMSCFFSYGRSEIAFLNVVNDKKEKRIKKEITKKSKKDWRKSRIKIKC